MALMTPADVAAEGNGRLREYTEQRKALAVLHARLKAAGGAIKQTAYDLVNGQSLTDLDAVRDHLNGLYEMIDDYRTTRRQCADLHKLLDQLGLAEAIKDLRDFPDY